MNKSGSKDLKKYQEYVKKKLGKLTPILQKAAVGDFTVKIDIPEKEDEFSELLVGLNLMLDDLREWDKTRKAVEEEKKRRLFELEQWRELTTGRELKMIGLKKEIKALKEEINNLKKKLGEPVE